VVEEVREGGDEGLRRDGGGGYIHIYIHTYIHTYIRMITYIHTYICRCICMYVYVEREGGW
jgi:hypothetical protein